MYSIQFYLCSVLGWIKKKLAEIALRRFTEHGISKSVESLAKCQKAVVLLNFEDYDSFPIASVIECLQGIVPQAKFTGLCYCSSPKKIERISPKKLISIITPKELDFRLQPTRWMEESAVVFDFRQKRDIPTQYLLQNEKAKWRAGGRRTFNEQFLDLMIQQKDDTDFTGLAEQLAIYFKMINSNSNAA